MINSANRLTDRSTTMSRGIYKDTIGTPDTLRVWHYVSIELKHERQISHQYHTNAHEVRAWIQNNERTGGCCSSRNIGKSAPFACKSSLKLPPSPAMLPSAHKACSWSVGLAADKKLISCGAAGSIFSA